MRCTYGQNPCKYEAEEYFLLRTDVPDDHPRKPQTYHARCFLHNHTQHLQTFYDQCTFDELMIAVVMES